jgi:hypothetical protein
MSFEAIWMDQGSIESLDGMLRDSDENEVEKWLCELAGGKVCSMLIGGCANRRSAARGELQQQGAE